MKVKQKTFGSLGCNCYLIIDEETNKSALIDCPDCNDDMFELIGDTDLQYILLTHGHFDHIIGVKGVKEKYGVPVAISFEDEGMLSSSKLSLAAFCNAPQNNTHSDMILGEGDSVELGSIKIDVISTPGHTKGSLCYIAENTIFTGDTLFACSCGRTDFPGGSGEEMLQSLRRLKNLEGNYEIMPGHMDVSNLDFERKNNPYMNM